MIIEQRAKHTFMAGYQTVVSICQLGLLLLSSEHDHGILRYTYGHFAVWPGRNR